MMILKTNRLKLAALILIAVSGATASAYDTFACVRDLLPVTEAASFQVHRKGFEKPFMLSERFMAFPSISNDVVTGFFIYSADHAHHYDSVQNPDGSLTPLAALRRTNPNTLYQLVAQPDGLETVTLKYMPGYGQGESVKSGPVILGSSVLPVVGSFMSRTNAPLKVIYHNPMGLDEEVLKQWVYDHSTRRPANVQQLELDHQILHLATKTELDDKTLWAPLKRELELRKAWIQSHNLDEETFREFSRIKETSCK